LPESAAFDTAGEPPHPHFAPEFARSRGSSLALCQSRMGHTDRHPLVSVVITCCNQARVLADAVTSVTARSARTQIVVVDEGSTDGTTAVARRLNVIFQRLPTPGRAAAKNRGLMASTGEFVIFLDA